MKEDPRIILISNDRNRGYLYSLINGVLNSKGKYITILDVDDLFSVENTLTTVYDEVEKYDLDMLGLGATQGILNMITHKYTHTRFHNYIETPIINQPELSTKTYSKNENGNIKRVHDAVWGYMIKRDFIIKAIKEIDDKFLNIIFCHFGDYFLFFLLTKRAKTLKYIKKLIILCYCPRKSIG